ncbi:hypothetical protein AJ87_09630 [Rhizobium yanglingense]|nr:hypothetical protein AJ87_09630 [Rhizobium yanglingense]
MLPFYIYYSMFGFQRVGDLIWAAADQRARGFLIGATAGRTTLSGEGLQHQDGSSHLVASTVPNCRAYDPAYAYEMAVVIDEGARRMLEQNRDEFFYITAMNENYAQPAMPEGSRDAIIKGLYRLGPKEQPEAKIRLVGAGAILPEVVAAGELLKTDWNIDASVFSATSFSELAREAAAIERENRLSPEKEAKQSHVEIMLAGDAPVVVATDYVRALPQLISPYVKASFVALGTDGFGRSDTRAALRSFFEVDKHNIVVAALGVLAREGFVEPKTAAEAISRYGIKASAPAPWTI